MAAAGAPRPDHPWILKQEKHMKQAQTAQGSAATVNTTPAFKSMNFFQKTVFVGKVAIFLVTLGFAYPNILSD
jgi:hypothetical protein